MDERSNVLLVVLDGARPDHLSCAGYERDTTPFLDQVAREGVRFAQAVTSAPWTLPAHAAMFTGLFSVTHGATSEQPVLSGAHRVLAEHLKASGYRTAAFCTNPSVSPAAGMGRGFDRFHTQRGGRLTGRAADYARRASDRVLGRRDAGARRTNRAVLDWLGASQDPFFAFVHYNEVHLPLRPPAPYDRMFMPRQFDGARVRAVTQGWDFHAADAPSSAEDLAIVRALYDGALRYADMRLKELADALASQGRWDRTLLVVTADHGEDLGEHGGLGHGGGMYDTLLRVPLLIRCPRRVPRGFVVEEFAQPVDLLPSILELLGLPPAGGSVQGRALLVDGHATPGPDFVIAERFRADLGARGRAGSNSEKRGADVRQKAIRTRREKFVWHSDEGNELYDLVRDRDEQQNLIERESDRAEQLRRRLFDWLASVERVESADGQPAEADAPARRQLD